MSRFIAWHGNISGPSDWCPLERHFQPLEKRCLWEAGALEINAGDVILGYSLGGRLALQAAAAAPEKFRAVIVLSAHPGLRDDVVRAERRQQDAAWSKLAATLPWAEFLARWDAQTVLGPGSEDRLALEPHRQAIARGFQEWSLGQQPDLRPALARLQCPLHWITGAQDGKFTQLASEAGCGELHVLPEAGHRLLMPTHAASLAALLRSLKISAR